VIRKAFRMSVYPGQQAEYAQRHNPIWAELDEVLRRHGVHSYSIFLDPGTNDLFAYAIQMVHEMEGPNRRFVPVMEDHELYPGIALVHTPGHTPGTMSVFVEAERRYAIVGDAIPTFENVRRWVPPGIVNDGEAALRSMRKIVSFADVVVPGHDAPFAVDRINDRFIQNSA